jgi:hypothetical protein
MVPDDGERGVCGEKSKWISGVCTVELWKLQPHLQLFHLSSSLEFIGYIYIQMYGFVQISSLAEVFGMFGGRAHCWWYIFVNWDDQRPGVVACTCHCHPSYEGGLSRKIIVQTTLNKKCKTPPENGQSKPNQSTNQQTNKQTGLWQWLKL